MEFMKRVAPELRETLANFPQVSLPEDLESARSPLIPPRVFEFVRIEKHMIPSVEGEIMVKIYKPLEGTVRPMPAVLWFHGGGYVLGHPDFDDDICERLVRDIQCLVVSVDYRLAPEHPYPAAIEDSYTSLLWLVNKAKDLNIDPDRIAVAGVSAGGGLATAVALMARDKRGPAIRFQLMLYPMLDDRNITPSSYEIIDNNPLWNRKNNLSAWSMYLGEHQSEVPYYAAPARAQDLAELPPAYICVGELDMFRDEIMDYVARLSRASVPVEFHLYPGCYHGFDLLVPNAEVSMRASQAYIDALRRAIG